MRKDCHDTCDVHAVLAQLSKSVPTGGYHDMMVLASEQSAVAAYMQSNQGVFMTEWVAAPNQALPETYWYVLYVWQGRMLCVCSKLHPTRPMLYDLSAFFPAANRLQRAIYDLTKITTKGAQDKRPWLSHGLFKKGVLNPYARSERYAKTRYPFYRVAGEGVHEIPVGPVHAGIIEPGHFRFSVVGERILKLEERLGYTHKGIHQLLIGKTLRKASQLIGRISGDSSIAYAYAFARACEHHLGIFMDRQTAIMRAVLLERERLLNHVGDLGAIINDSGCASLAVQFSILKERLIRENAALTGHRYMMDVILPVQTMVQWEAAAISKMVQQLAVTARELSRLERICHHHHGVQDRLQTTGIVNQETAQALGLLGVAAKASKVAFDLRKERPYFPYTALLFSPVTETEGDVAARVNVRFQESQQSIEIIKQLLMKLQRPDDLDRPDDLGNDSVADMLKSGLDISSSEIPMIGLGYVEGWRGPVCVAVSLDQDHRVAFCHFHDVSWQNWLALEYAVMGNIVADFPIINKSFNLSYSGQDS